MKLVVTFILLAISVHLHSQFSVKWEELTNPEFKEAVVKSEKVCVIPLGIIEKHGPYLPLGTDLIVVRDAVVEAAKKEYVVVFPEFYVGQINESRHQAGTIAYSPELVLKMLDETCSEIARNGFKKIILVNGHGGNNSMLSYYGMALLNKPKDYVVYFTNGWGIYADSLQQKEVEAQFQKVPANSPGHAGVDEASQIMVIRPDLLKLNYITQESGENLSRLSHLKFVTSGIDWYASYPNQYAGDAKYANKELGNAMMKATIDALAKAFLEVKTDTQVPALHQQFYHDAENPLQTK
jgi:creatinine amidohydrolase